MWAPQPLIMFPKELPDEHEQQQKRHQAAMNALITFVSNYSPATQKEADTFFSTNEIVQSIQELTGVTLDSAEIFETMISMDYQYQAMNGLDFNWMLKKE